MALTNKQRAFINEYLTDFNATRAAERAGYSGNENTLAVTGHDLLRNPKISAAIEKRLAENAMTANEVLMRLADIARGDIGGFIEVMPGGRGFMLNLEEAEQNERLHLIKKLKYNANGYPEIELYDAQAALVKLGEVHGLFKQQQEVDSRVTLRVVYGDADDSTT